MKKILPGTVVSVRYGERTEATSGTSYGIGVERAYLQRRPKELTSVLGLAVGKDDLGGTWLDGRLGAGAGLRGMGMHLVFGAGGELASAGVADPMMPGSRTRNLAPGLFLESELRLGLGSGVGMSGRWGRLYGGPFDEEDRLSGSLIWRTRSGLEWSLFAARRAYEGGELDELGIGMRLPYGW